MLRKIDGAERLDALKALGDSVAMHGQKFGRFLNIAPVFQVDLQCSKEFGAFMGLVIVSNGSNLLQVEVMAGMVARERISVAIRAQITEWHTGGARVQTCSDSHGFLSFIKPTRIVAQLAIRLAYTGEQADSQFAFHLLQKRVEPLFKFGGAGIPRKRDHGIQAVFSLVEERTWI